MCGGKKRCDIARSREKHEDKQLTIPASLAGVGAELNKEDQQGLAVVASPPLQAPVHLLLLLLID